jgi:hypothetical protein
VRDVAAGFGNQPKIFVIEVDGVDADEAWSEQTEVIQASQRAALELAQAVFDFLLCLMDMAMDRHVELFR